MNIISYSQALNSNGNPQVYKDPNNDTFTIAVGATVNIVYDISDEYSDVGTLVSIVFSPALPTGLTASLNEANGILTISGIASAADTLSNHTITINQNDGGPVSTLLTDTLGLEVLEPNFLYEQNSCTYCLEFEPVDNDTTSQNTPLADRGVIEYYSVVDNVETLLGSGTYNGLFTHCFCGAAADLEIKTVLTIRAIPNCGGTSPIVFQATVDPNSIVDIIEYQPLLVPITFGDCCQVIDKLITVYPTEINLYREAPHDECNGDDDGLVITWTKDGEQLQAPTAYNIATVIENYETPTSLSSGYTPTELGTYVVTLTATNCCATTTETITFNICNDWTVEKGDCNTIVITNSSTSAITYTVKELGENGFTVVDISGELEDIELSAGASVTINLVSDNLYTVTINNQEYVLLLDCNIKLCEKELLLDFLCGTEGTCNVAELNSRQLKYIRFNSLRGQLYGKWNEYYQTQSIYTVLNLNDENDDLLHLKDIIIKLQKVCDSCGISINCNTCKRTIKLTDNCGCN
jgi:hypothetical protein